MAVGDAFAAREEIMRTMRGLQDRLKESQWWPAAEMRRQQFGQLSLLLDHAVATVPFYAKRLFRAGHVVGRPVDEETWSRIPVLTRADLQSAGADMASTAPPPQHGRIFELRSSGSTGMPVAVKTTTYAQLWFKAIVLREQLWHRRDLGGSFAAIRRYEPGIALPPDGDRQPRWASRAAVPFNTGPLLRLTIRAPASVQAAWLARNDPDYLLTYPSNLASLVVAARDAGLRPRRLREITTMAEIVSPELRALVREVWNVPIRDTYSAKEVGYMALQCPQHEHLHVQSEATFVEIIDESGRPCVPGGIGRVVVTSLHNFAMPLIRYQIGDYAEVGPPCACGRGLPVLARVMGRVRNMLVGRNGDRYWPSFGTTRFRHIAPVRQHQFVQTARGVLKARFVVERALTEDEEEALRAHIQSRLPEPFAIAFDYVDDIPPSEGGKLENFISEIA
jgi:phenylacetate-CoA ligase